MRITRAAVSSIESSVVSITGQPSRRWTARAVAADLLEAFRVDCEADDLRRLDVEEVLRGADALDDRHVRGLPAEVAEVHGERRLRRARHADENDVRVVEPAAHAVVVLDRELDRLHALEVRLVERVPGTTLHLRGHARDLGDRLDRVAEQVAIVETRAAAQAAHLLAQLRLDERVDDDRRPPPRAFDGELEVLDRLHLGVAHLLERLIRKLSL